LTKFDQRPLASNRLPVKKPIWYIAVYPILAAALEPWYIAVYAQQEPNPSRDKHCDLLRSVACCISDRMLADFARRWFRTAFSVRNSLRPLLPSLAGYTCRSKRVSHHPPRHSLAHRVPTANLNIHQR
jgi:hypothetical protein